MAAERFMRSVTGMVNPVIEESNVLQREGDQDNNIAQPVIVSNDPSKYKCRVCESVFSAISNRRRHEKNLHGFDPEMKQTLKCSECTAVFHREKDIIEHFKEIHTDINFSEDIKTFDSIEEFKVWKENMEKETATSYICRREIGPWKTFTCHRSGVFISKSTGKRHLKLGGSNKTGFYCPAKICCKFMPDGKVNIKFLPTHIGHECEVGRLRLSMTEKNQIAGLMRAEVPLDSIMHKIAETASPTKRLSATKKHDLQNIAGSSGLHLNVVRCSNDVASVDSWVKQAQSQEADPILIYKLPDKSSTEHSDIEADDFVLGFMNEAQEELFKLYSGEIISIDSTHGTKKYDIQLTSLVVKDDNWEGFYWQEHECN